MGKELAIKHYGLCDGSRFIPNDANKLNQQHIALRGKKCYMVLEEVQENATPDQHAYYRAGIIKTCLATEYFAHSSDADVHENFVSLFLGYYVFIKANGEVREEKRYYSTGDLKKKAFANFLEKVIAWCSEKGILIHSPEDYYLEKFKTINRDVTGL